MRTFNSTLNWRIDDDGALRVTICALKEGVYDYNPNEVPEGTTIVNGRSNQYVPSSEFTEEAIRSLEGKSITIGDHVWREPETAMKDGMVVGAVAGTPYTKDGSLLCDAIISDKESIDKIISGDLVEVSAGYNASLEDEGGVFNEQTYNSIQKDLQFNHILLLPKGKGRCGSDVRILNNTLGGNKMGTLRIRVGNSEKTYRFQNAEDQQLAEEMVNEERAFNAEQLSKSMEERTALQGQLEELKSQVADLEGQLSEHDGHLETAKAEIERLLSPEIQEEMVQEAVEQQSDEEEIINAELEELEDDDELVENSESEEEVQNKVMNSIRKSGGKLCNLAQRRKNTVAFVMNRKGVNIPETWDQSAYDVSFETLLISAKNRVKNSKPERSLNGKKVQVENAKIENSNRSRVLRPMQAKNKKAGE